MRECRHIPPPKGGCGVPQGEPRLLYKPMQKRLFVYVDGFNLYYGALKGTPYKGLDLKQLCRRLFPNHDLHKIKYFTARVKPHPKDPNQPQRQSLYLRALETIPIIEIIEGLFLSHKIRLPLANPAPQGHKTAEVIHTQEKGSDVNLATHLIFDAFDSSFDVAAVITNDSDLVLPIRLVREKLKKEVWVVGYDPKLQKRYGKKGRQSKSLIEAAGKKYKKIRENHLKNSLFPDCLSDSQGVFCKPQGW